MAVTAQQVFESAMYLMDTQSTGGAADIPENLEYKNKTLPILNILLNKYSTSSDTFNVGSDGSRRIISKLNALTDEIQLDDAICLNVIPYDLAAHLLAAEGNNALAAFYNQSAQENLIRLRASIPTESVDIMDLYGGIQM